MSYTNKLPILLTILFALILSSCGKDSNEDDQSTLDRALITSLEYASETNALDFFELPSENDLKGIPQDPNNPLTKEKITLGKNLFHETAFGTEGKFEITKEEFSCASCHHAGAGFQSGIAQGIGEGGQGFGFIGEARRRNQLCDPTLCDVQPLRSPTVLNGAYQPLMLWSGQFGATDQNEGTEDQWTPDTPKAINSLGFEGLETQAIAGLKVHRLAIDEDAVIEHNYKADFDAAFPDTPMGERYSLVTAGLAIAAYERTIMANEAPFQRYIKGDLNALTDYQKMGAILFFGKANCNSCHTGPALNKMEFHALGMNEFNPNEVTHYLPEDPARFGRFAFTKNEEDRYKFKTPQLYNLKDLSFLGHGASFHSIQEVIEYKNNAIAENNEVPASSLSKDFTPLNLTETEIARLVDFIENGLHDPSLERYVPTSLPSSNCFPNNDSISQEDLGCN